MTDVLTTKVEEPLKLLFEIWNKIENITMSAVHFAHLHPGGGGGTPLYGLYRYVRPQRVWFFSRFGHK